jgi:hemolysin-activating ACP:hemolysin acyltransferase
MHCSDTVDEAVALLLEVDGCDWPEWLIRYHFEIPFSCGQAACVRDSSEKLVAFMVWAFVGDDVHRELREGAEKILHLSEWNEGLHLWLKIFSPTSRLIPFTLRREVRNLAKRFGIFHLRVDGFDEAKVFEGRWLDELYLRNISNRLI